MNNNPHEIFDLQTASPEQLRALQLKSLEILIYFRDFCKKHNLNFSLCGGTCIGAVRHKGFIPWDDDIDVFMLRDDYERLEDLWEKHSDTKKYSICRTTKEKNYHQIVIAIKDNDTTFINSHSKDEDIVHGVGIDVLPLDGYPDSKLQRINQVIHAMIFSLFNAQRLPDNQGEMARWISKLILAIVPSQKIRYKLWTHSEKQMKKYKIKDTDYIAQLVSGFKFMKFKYPKEIFETTIDKEFEGYQMPVPAGYDAYLKMGFGNYMEFPPEEDQVAKHNTVYINLKESYKRYKGIYYCTDWKETKNE